MCLHMSTCERVVLDESAGNEWGMISATMLSKKTSSVERPIARHATMWRYLSEKL